MSFRRLAIVFVALTALIGLVPARASAQYFGRNKVQYEDFDFRVLSTDHFNVYYYPAEKEAVEDAARMAERWYVRHSDLFQHTFQEKKPIILYANHADFEQTNTLSGFQNEATGGVTEGLKDRVVIPLAADYFDTDHVMGHELVHAFQYDLAKSQTGPGIAAMGRVPLWMVEGMAEFLSLGRVDANTAMWMRDAVLHEDFPSIKDLSTSSKYFPYRYGQALWGYIAGRYGDRAVPAMYTYATERGLEAASRRVLGIPVDTLSAEWAAATKEAEQPIIADRTHPDSVGTLLVGPTRKGTGTQNLAPVLSQDGRYLAFLSERGLFSIDLYLADAHTGEVIRKLTSSATDTHFDALSFMNSSGSFSPDGERFVTVVFEDGDQKLVVLNTSNGKIEQTLKTDEIGAIGDPTWSPDGSRIAFTGNVGGISDLYVYDLETSAVRKLTEGRTAELQPAWSPDGTLLAYTTDAGARTDFQKLTYSPMSVAIMDVASGESKQLQLFPDAKNINPVFAPDGKSVYFIADPDGVPDIFRVELTSGRLFRVTHVATGVSGLTEKSPAITIAKDGRLAFSVFNKQGFNVMALGPAAAQGEPVQPQANVAYQGDVLPPVADVTEGPVYAYLNDPTTGLPSGANFTEKPYQGGLSLDMIGPPSLGVATSTFGTGVAGGVSAYFSDMLGNQQLAAAIQANGTVKDIGGMAQYVNLDHRWNWGAVVGHIPYLLLYRGVQDNGDGTYAINDYFDRIYIDQAQGLVQYPFSQVRRIEFQGGYTRYSYNREIQQYIVTPTGQVLDQRKVSGGATPPALNLMQASAALVSDFSVFGFTSPIQGGRSRFEVSPTFGSLQFTSVTADYRRYFFANPVTFAVRGYHYGRYGRDSEANAIQPLFAGYEWYVRGYDPNSFDQSECNTSSAVTSSFTGCQAMDQLIGSRLAVANMELRIPLLGVEQFGLINFPYLPTELSFFADGALAWGQNSPASLTYVRNLSDLSACTSVGDPGCEHHPVFSAGVSARMNILGFMVLEAYYAYPFQRPQKGWHWGFQIMPGW